MRYDTLQSIGWILRSLRWKTKQKYKISFCTLNKFGSLGVHNAMHNNRLKPVRIPLSAVEWFDMRFNRSLHAWYCVRQGCWIFYFFIIPFELWSNEFTVKLLFLHTVEMILPQEAIQMLDYHTNNVKQIHHWLCMVTSKMVTWTIDIQMSMHEPKCV